jgi:hypothetical protein
MLPSLPSCLQSAEHAGDGCGGPPGALVCASNLECALRSLDLIELVALVRQHAALLAISASSFITTTNSEPVDGPSSISIARTGA